LTTTLGNMQSASTRRRTATGSPTLHGNGVDDRSDGRTLASRAIALATKERYDPRERRRPFRVAPSEGADVRTVILGSSLADGNPGVLAWGKRLPQRLRLRSETRRSS